MVEKSIEIKKLGRSITCSLLAWYVDLVMLIYLLMNRDSLSFSSGLFKFLLITLLLPVIGFPIFILNDIKKLKKIKSS